MNCECGFEMTDLRDRLYCQSCGMSVEIVEPEDG